jgi:hypothetical protein
LTVILGRVTITQELNTVFFIKSWLRDWPYEAAATIAQANGANSCNPLRVWQMKNSIVEIYASSLRRGFFILAMARRINHQYDYANWLAENISGRIGRSKSS